MKLRKIWAAVGVAIAIGLVVAALMGTGILAKGNDQEKPGKGDDHEKGKDSLFVYANTAFGFLGNINPQDICVESSRYKVGQEVVWRIRVLDENGNAMDDTKLKSVAVKLPDGQIFDAVYGGHPPGPTPTDHFWSAVWVIPANYPTGTAPYEVVATALHGNRTGTFSDFNVGPSLLTIVQ